MQQDHDIEGFIHYAAFVCWFVIIQISEEQILPFPEHKAGQSFPYPPTLCFEVSRLSENDHSKLRQRIYAQGAIVVNGNTPSFLISSTPPPIVKGDFHMSDYYSTANLMSRNAM